MPTLPELIASGDYLILDTETTGLYDDAEIVSIAIIDSQGFILLDTLVQPYNPIPAEATAIHGITNEMVANAPLWDAVWNKVVALLDGKNVVVYNMAYDVNLLYQSSAPCDVDVEWWGLCDWYCAMAAYAEYWGAWSDYHQSYTWQRLTAACSQQGIEVKDAHGALGDCLMTLALCKKVWGEQ